MMENLDCMDLDGLRALLNSSDNERIKDYCQYKIIAMRARLAGDIAKAIRNENRCDEVYRRLPAELRW
jgi:hypothetical protein